MTDPSSFDPFGFNDASKPEGQKGIVERGVMTDDVPFRHPNHPIPISVVPSMPSLVDSPLLPVERSFGGGMHPGRPSVASSTTSTVPSTSVASLIQSAAKLSLQNEKKEAKLFQDDEYDDFVSSLFVAQKSPNLQSLQKRVLPILPDEQDRKRFIGCLAAVIVSLYQYDNDEKDKKRAATRNTSENDDVVVLMNEPINDVSSSFYEDEEEDDNFDYFEEVTEGAQVRPPMRSGSKSTLSSSSNTNTSSSMGPLGSVFQRSREAALRAQARHRKRRHEIFCRFLVSATEQLGLEKGHGRCFLPLLDRKSVV